MSRRNENENNKKQKAVFIPPKDTAPVATSGAGGKKVSLKDIPAALAAALAQAPRFRLSGKTAECGMKATAIRRLGGWKHGDAYLVSHDQAAASLFLTAPDGAVYRALTVHGYGCVGIAAAKAAAIISSGKFPKTIITVDAKKAE